MDKTITPMLIGEESEPFDSDEYIFELKMDGIRCLVFIEKNQVDLRNKRNVKLLPKFPEMEDIYKYVKNDCILDGELYCFHNGKIDFSKIQKRSLMNNPFKIEIESKVSKAVFTAFDILYYKDQDITHLPLLERKKILNDCIIENDYFNQSRYIFHDGIALYHRTKQLNLEGIVAKLKTSTYQVNKRTKNWIKIKYLKDDDFVVVGYTQKTQGINLILAQYDQNQLIYIGQVITSIVRLPKVEYTSQKCFDIEDALWIKPYLVAKVKFMERTSHGSLRQPVFIDFVYDKKIEDCIFRY